MDYAKADSSRSSRYRSGENESLAFAINGFPMKRLTNRFKPEYDDGWVAAYKADKEKYFQAVLTNKKMDQLEREKPTTAATTTPKRKILKNVNFAENEENTKKGMLDGFYLIQLCCVDDPLDIASVDISDKNINQIKSEDMTLFENITNINANENSLNLESFKCFRSLKCLSLSCNNIKTIRLKNGEFDFLESLDLSFNNLTPNDVSHLGVLRNVRILKLTGNNLTHLADSFSKQFVSHQDGRKIVRDRFANLEELYLDKNKLREEDSFDVLSVLKRLKRLHLNENLIACIPKLKIFKKVHVVQEFSKSYYARKTKSSEKSSSAKSAARIFDSKINESMVKDLDRPSSEMNLHHSNTLRNSFILEEEEENDGLDGEKTREEKTSARSLVEERTSEFEKKFELPFPELVYINLADNQICEDDDLIGLAAWPSLSEIILYGNPIIFNNVGFTPLIKKYLIDRLGINIKRLRPLKPLKTQFLMPLREERIVDTKVPKVEKFPIELRLLGYDQPETKAIDYPDRSNFSSAKSVALNNETIKHFSFDSHDTVGHTNQAQESKKASTFFMTQVRTIYGQSKEISQTHDQTKGQNYK